jgi:hypothetical protein
MVSLRIETWLSMEERLSNRPVEMHAMGIEIVRQDPSDSALAETMVMMSSVEALFQGA